MLSTAWNNLYILAGCWLAWLIVFIILTFPVSWLPCKWAVRYWNVLSRAFLPVLFIMASCWGYWIVTLWRSL